MKGEMRDEKNNFQYRFGFGLCFLGVAGMCRVSMDNDPAAPSYRVWGGACCWPDRYARRVVRGPTLILSRLGGRLPWWRRMVSTAAMSEMGTACMVWGLGEHESVLSWGTVGGMEETMDEMIHGNQISIGLTQSDDDGSMSLIVKLNHDGTPLAMCHQGTVHIGDTVSLSIKWSVPVILQIPVIKRNN
jgi:hypothetical protein